MKENSYTGARSLSNATDTNPFPGLRPFHEEEEYLFFGRENQVDTMVDKLGANRFLAVVGGSGSGKSSLVNCGLRPALHGGLMSSAGTVWRMAQFRPGNDPIGEMARALAGEGVLFSNYESEGLTLAEIVDTSLRMSKLGLLDIYEQANLGENENLLVVVDQFEELFRYRKLGDGEQENLYGVSEEATAFVNLLLEIKKQTKYPIHVVLTMRSDFLGDCTQFEGLAEAINEGQYLVPRMTRDERRAAISGPVGVGGAEISPVLLTRLVNDVGDNPDQLSILQHALNRTWAEWKKTGGKGPIDLPHYEAIGTMALALDHHAEEAYAELKTGRSKKVCEKIFKALTDKATDPRGVRRPTRLSSLCELAGASEAEVTEMIDVFRQPNYSFLMPPAGVPLQSNTVIDISHESLMRVWAHLGTWADEEALSARIYRRLAETSELYDEGKAGLWKDPDLQLALKWKEDTQPNEAWAGRYNPEFESAMGFLHKSKVARGWRRALGAFASLAVLVGLSIALGVNYVAKGVARTEKEKAEQAAKTALVAEDAAKKSEKRAVAARDRADEAKLKAEKAEAEAKRSEITALAEKNRADNAKVEAESAEAAALKSAKKEKIAANLAVAEKKKADEAAEKEKFAANEAQAARMKAERLVYDANIILGQQEINEGQMARAQALLKPYLNDGPESLRGFEWFYVWGQLYQVESLSDHSESVVSVAFSPDGKTLATGSRDKTVKLWDVETQGLVATLEGHSLGVLSVAFSPDGKTLATGSDDGTVNLWDVETKKEVATLAGHSLGVVSVAFSPYGQTLATGSWDKSVKLWDVETKKEMATLEGHSESVLSAAFSPDGQTLATGSRDKTVKLWDLETSKEVATLEGHSEFVLSVAFSPDGKTLATGSDDDTARLWDVETREEVATLEGHSDTVNSLAFSPDGKTLATGSDDETAKLWDVETKKEVVTFESHFYAVLSVAFSPDGNTLATGSGDKTVKLWDVGNQKEAATLEGHADYVLSVAFSPDGKTLATGSDDDTARLWDVETRKEVATLEGHSDSVLSAAFSPDGRMLATASRDKTVKLWDVETKKEVATLEGHTYPVLSVAFSPDGKTLATGSDDKTARLWDVETKKEVAILEGHRYSVLSVAFSPDGQTLATGSEDETLRLWDVETQELVVALDGRCDEVNWVAFSPDGRTLATACHDETTRLWDVETQELVATLEGHSLGVLSVAFSPDGKTLATVSDDQTIKLWDVETRKEVATLEGHSDSVVSVAFSPDGRTLATGSDDQTAKLWFGATDEEIEAQRNR